MEAPVTPRRVRIFNTIEDLARNAAELFIAEAEAAIASHGRFYIALSGGSTPGPLYSTLATDKYRSRTDWERIHFFWADERCVPKDHPDSNFRLASDLLLAKLTVPDCNVHRIPGEMTADLAAIAYERDLSRCFPSLSLPRFDLIFLGVGADGHTASIFPCGKAANDFSRTVIPVYAEKLDSHRVTLTMPVLNNARTVVFLVTGKTKADIVRNILVKNNPCCPAARINPTMGKAIWLLDREAAYLLTERDIQ